jgi:hypothetical protein
MSRFIEGEHQQQSTRFPEVLDDYIFEENSVRVIEAFVEELDLSGLGIRALILSGRGGPPQLR